MSTNYTSNPTAVEAPATVPAVNNPPVVVIPSDGDAANAASITQALKVLGDNEAFILQVLGGTRSAKSLNADGTGGATVTTPDGTLKLSATAIQTSIPAAAVTAGVFYKDFAPFALVQFNGTGAAVVISLAMNIQSAVRNSAGNYTFTFATNPSRTPLVLQSQSTAGFMTVTVGPSSFTVTTANTSNTATDFNSPTSVVILGA